MFDGEREREREIGEDMLLTRYYPSHTACAFPDEDKEIVLDFIVERKTMDDLVSSIKDGRFQEQKVYLASSF